MKKLILTFAIALISVLTFAQTNLTITSANMADLKPMADAIAQSATQTYTFDKEGIPADNPNYYIISYQNAANATDKLNVFFRIDMIGSNAATQTEGTPQYTFYGVAGQFIDLFGFWSKHINPAAVAETITARHEDKIVKDGYTYLLKESGATWKIDCRAKRN